jgi:hypothetical protein
MLVKCKICGKEFEPKRTAGRRPDFCSEECRRKAHTKKTTRYLNERYKNDEEFRKRRIASNIESNRRKREERKEQAMNGLVLEIMNAGSAEEVRKILDKNVRLKSHTYA